ncbi:hypothetical protein JHK85_052412 [Glycine max]|nr:hypothetical protein JHK85_052412 [Glycine max]
MRRKEAVLMDLYGVVRRSHVKENAYKLAVLTINCGIGLNFTVNWTEILTKFFPNENSDGRCLKLLPFPPRLEDHVRASFALTGADLEKLRKRVLSKWDIVDRGAESEPPRLSSFVLTCAYALACIAKAIHGVEKEKEKFAFAFTVDCRARLEPPIHDNYFGNCVWGHVVDAEPLDFIKEEAFAIVAKSTALETT